MIYVFGSLNVDFVSRVAVIPRPGETVLAREFFQVFGGKGANQAVAAARAVAKPGIVAMIGAVGKDALGKSVRENLVAEGIDVGGLAEVDAETGCAFITVDDAGENAITVASGANMMTSADMLPGNALVTDVFVLQMEVPVEENIRVVELAKANDARVILNLAPVPAKLGAEQLRSLLQNTNLLIVNQHELQQSASILECATDNDLDTAVALARKQSLDIVVTRGSQGASLVRASGAMIQAPALPVTVADTTGAGDTFVGALAAELSLGFEEEDALRRAVVAASLSCEGLGAQAAMPQRSEILGCFPKRSVSS